MTSPPARPGPGPREASTTAPAALAPWVHLARPATAARTVLLCFPHAGGGASAYRDWPAALGGHGIEVWPVQLPGRENRRAEPASTDLSALTSTLGEFFGPLLADRQYAIYGHSAGAAIAYAFAQHAADLGSQAPRHLFLGASRPPGHPDPDFPIHRMPAPALLAKLQTYGGIPAAALSHPEMLDMMLATARADLRLVETHWWAAGQRLDCPLTVVGGVADRNVPVNLLPAWRSITRGSFNMTVLPGGHFPAPAAERQLMEVLASALD